MTCPKCNSENVFISQEQISAKTNVRKTGCLWGIGRILLICCTCGLWLIVGKRDGTNNTKFKHKTIAICQNCGNQWYIK